MTIPVFLVPLSLQEHVLTKIEIRHRQCLAGAKGLQLLVSCLHRPLSTYGYRRMRIGYASMHNVHMNRINIICPILKKKEKKERPERESKTFFTSISYGVSILFTQCRVQNIWISDKILHPGSRRSQRGGGLRGQRWEGSKRGSREERRARARPAPGQ